MKMSAVIARSLLAISLTFACLSVARAQSQGAATPGSCIAADTNGTRPIPDGKKWYLVQVATSHPNAACPGRNVQIVELRGWLRNVETGCNSPDPDWHSNLEVDSSWAWSQGIDLGRLIRVGDIAFNAVLPFKTDAPEKAVATPTIELELWGWRSSDHPGQSPPTGWGFTNADATNCSGVYWPFNPLNPTGQKPLAEGQYVRVVGSLVTDEPHEHEAGFPAFTCGNFGVNCSYGNGDPMEDPKTNNIKMDWGNGINDQATDPARWTEIHPPDLIDNLLQDPGRKETLRGIAVLSEHCLVGHCAAQTVDEDIAPPAACPSGYRVDYQELVGTATNETNLNTVEDGNAGLHGSNTGAQITVGPTSIHVHVMVRGRSANGAYGRFKALYRVFCSVPPRPLSARATIVGQSPLTVAVTVTDPGTKLPVPGVEVSVDGGYQGQSGAKTPADGTVRLQFGACPQSGPLSIHGYRFGAPYPACPIHAGSNGYQRVDLWTPVLAAKARHSSTNSVSVSVTDPLTKTPAGDATVNLLDGQGRTLVSGKTAADGTVTLDSSGCSKSFLSSCGVMVMKPGYLNCSFVVVAAGEGQCSGDYVGAVAAAGPATISVGPLTGPNTAHTAQISGGLTSNNTASFSKLLSATVCPTADGKSCLSAGQVRPGSPLMNIVTVTSGGSPVAGATVSVSGQPTFTATTNATGVAVITHLACFALGTGAPRVGQTPVPVHTPQPCQATVTMAGYQSFSFSLP